MSWKGSTDTEDESGIASFLIKGKWHDMPLSSYTEACTLHRLFSEAFYQGHEVGFNEVTFYIEDTIKTRKFYNGYK